MARILALKTTQLIDEMVRRDQGAAYRGWLGKVLPHIGDAYRTDDDKHRSHLGASIVGNECARAVWYNFRWVTAGQFEGRVLRLFNRGHLEEGRFIAYLLMIGVQVFQQDENGKQYRITHAEGHMGGSGDGVGIGIPDIAPGVPALLEFKTHNDKSFNALKADGVRTSKFEHYVQANVYMRKMALGCCLYMGVNKNTDELYGEILPLDTTIADQFLDRGNQIVWLQQPPKRLNESAGYYKCKWCDHRPVCHLKAAPDVNCRTCEYSAPVAGGEGAWACTRHNAPISKEVQLVGCPDYTVKKQL